MVSEPVISEQMLEFWSYQLSVSGYSAKREARMRELLMKMKKSIEENKIEKMSDGEIVEEGDEVETVEEIDGGVEVEAVEEVDDDVEVEAIEEVDDDGVEAVEEVDEDGDAGVIEKVTRQNTCMEVVDAVVVAVEEEETDMDAVDVVEIEAMVEKEVDAEAMREGLAGVEMADEEMRTAKAVATAATGETKEVLGPQWASHGPQYVTDNCRRQLQRKCYDPQEPSYGPQGMAEIELFEIEKERRWKSRFREERPDVDKDVNEPKEKVDGRMTKRGRPPRKRLKRDLILREDFVGF